MKKIFVVVRIGCIECGVSSKAIAAFDNKEEAEKFSTDNPWDSWEEEGGEGHQEVFEVEYKNL
jgi:hypothetical protein